MSPVIIRLLRREMAALRENFKIIFFTSGVSVIGLNLLIYWAHNYTIAINATLLNSTSPLFIFLLSALLIGEKMEFKYWVSMAISISMIGVLFVITQGSFERMLALQFNIADLIMVLAVISWALYSIYIKKIFGKLPSLAIFGFTLAIGFVVMNPAVTIKLSIVPVGEVDISDWSALSRGDDDWAIERIDFIESHVIGTVATFFFLGEVITIPHKNFSEILYKVLLLSTLFVYNKNQRKI